MDGLSPLFPQSVDWGGKMNSDLSMLFTANCSVDYPFWRVLRLFFLIHFVFFRFCFCVGGRVTGDGGAEMECNVCICIWNKGMRYEIDRYMIHNDT